MVKIIRNIDINNFAYDREVLTNDLEQKVVSILADVKSRGDQAIVELTEKFDGALNGGLLVTEKELDDAEARIDKKFLDILIKAKNNIVEYHTNQLKKGFEFERDGVIIGQRYTSIEKVGAYVPGGTAAYPSTVLMNVLPAVVAGVKDITVCTPAKNGKIKDEILVACRLANVTRIIKTGGAQAIAGMAYGTECIPKVDKIVGPGNAFVAIAKKFVFGQVGIDMVAGPSEILIIADETANASFVAADMLSQAEHDVLASSILITDSNELAMKVQKELEVQTPALLRSEIASKAIQDGGAIFVVDDIADASKISNIIAPEHLELCVCDPMSYMENITNAGSIFLGHYTPEPLGDYFAGPNHTLPTSGSARFSSPLSVDDYIKKSSYIYYTKQACQSVADEVAEFANREGLQGHANSMLIRKEK